VSNTPIEDEVVAFVAEFTSYTATKIKPTTTLFGDIGIDGDDGDAILTAFKERFRVDMAGCRPVHFGAEGFMPSAPLDWIRQLWVSLEEKDSTPESRVGLVPITVQDLIESARARRWVLKYEGKANQSVQHNAGSRPSSDDSPASETPSAPAPRGCYEEKVVKRIE